MVYIVYIFQLLKNSNIAKENIFKKYVFSGRPHLQITHESLTLKFDIKKFSVVNKSIKFLWQIIQ